MSDSYPICFTRQYSPGRGGVPRPRSAFRLLVGRNILIALVALGLWLASVGEVSAGGLRAPSLLICRGL